MYFFLSVSFMLLFIFVKCPGALRKALINKTYYYGGIMMIVMIMLIHVYVKGGKQLCPSHQINNVKGKSSALLKDSQHKYSHWQQLNENTVGGKTSYFIGAGGWTSNHQLTPKSVCFYSWEMGVICMTLTWGQFLYCQSKLTCPQDSATRFPQGKLKLAYIEWIGVGVIGHAVSNTNFSTLNSASQWCSLVQSSSMLCPFQPHTHLSISSFKTTQN